MAATARNIRYRRKGYHVKYKHIKLLAHYGFSLLISVEYACGALSLSVLYPV